MSYKAYGVRRSKSNTVAPYNSSNYTIRDRALRNPFLHGGCGLWCNCYYLLIAFHPAVFVWESIVKCQYDVQDSFTLAIQQVVLTSSQLTQLSWQGYLIITSSCPAHHSLAESHYRYPSHHHSRAPSESNNRVIHCKLWYKYSGLCGLRSWLCTILFRDPSFHCSIE